MQNLAVLLKFGSSLQSNQQFWKSTDA